MEPGSKYLSKKTFESLNEMFEASQEIQDWLTECAQVVRDQVCRYESFLGVPQVISKDVGENVSWVTPLGLPVVQPYTSISRPHNTYGRDLSNLFSANLK